MSRYWGQFRSIQRNKLYTVEIITATGSVNKEITLGPNPFTTSMNTSGDTIYTPLKSSSATIQIVADEYFTDLYSSTATGNLVRLKDASNNILWYGYTQPNMFNAPYDHAIETYEFEAYDALSALQYFDYETINTDASGNAIKSFVSFAEIINHILLEKLEYDDFFVSTNTKVNEKRNAKLFDTLMISEQNFYDEDDKPMKMKEVLEEICKFCNLTAVAYENNVYFLDYDAIKHDINTYNSHNSSTAVTISQVKTIQASDYASSGANLTLDNTYNKVTVKDSFYSVESLLPSMWDNKTLVNQQSPNYTYSFGPIKTGGKVWKCKYRSYWNDLWENTVYNNSGTQISRPSVINALTAENYIAGNFMKYNVASGDSETEVNENMKWDDYSNYILFTRNGYTGTADLKVLKNKPASSKPFFLSTNAKILFSGSMILGDEDGQYENMSGGTANVGYFPGLGLTSTFQGNFWGGSTLTMTKSNLRFKMQLKIGDYYYNGSSWRTTQSQFDLPYYKASEASQELEEKKKAHEIFYVNFPIRNNCNYYSKLSSDGYYIDLNGIGSNTVIPASPEITMFNPSIVLFNFGGVVYSPVKQIWLKDFDIKVVMTTQEEDDDSGVNDSDTGYTNVINENYVSELSPIEFKICTWDEKTVNYSSVTYNDYGSYHFVDKLYNAALNDELLRAEQYMIKRIVNQYSSPAIKLELNLFNDIRPWAKITENVVNKTMIVDSFDVDYVNDKATYNLIEKK